MSDLAIPGSLQPQQFAPSERPEESATVPAHEPPASAHEPPPPARPQAPISMRPKDPMILFAYACLRRDFKTLAELRPVGAETPPPEAIHQMRIATRRLRASLRMFGRMLPHDEAKRFNREFRWLACSLGQLRDLDVQAENFRAYERALGTAQPPELGGYELHLRRARAEAREKLHAVFTAPRYAELIGGFAEVLDGAPSPAALRRWRSYRIADGMKKLLRKSVRRVLKLGRKVSSDTSDERLHRLRIRAKRLRYELEFFRDVYPSLDKAAKATKHLQDVLGEHQDACTAATSLVDYARSIRPRGRRRDTMPAAFAALLEREKQKAEAMRLAFAAEWRRFERIVDRTALV
jgi:triphosphatase